MTTTTVRVQSFPREEFLTRRWRYRPGEHVTLLGPTQSGKTTLGYQLLQRVIRPELPAVILVMKPRDRVVSRWSAELGLRTVGQWPPPPRPWEKPPGWVLWPKHTFEPDKDDEILRAQFRKAILDNYRRGERITFGDEVYGLAGELKLTRELTAVWSRGAAMGNGLWTATQRPRAVPLMAYSQAEHVLMAYTPDKADRDRYSEIGGIDPDIVKQVTARLPKFHWLYVRRTGPAMCIVEA